MRATTNHGLHTLAVPAGGVIGGKPIRISDSFAVVPQKTETEEGAPFAGISTGIEITVEVAAAIPNIGTPVRVNAAGVVTAGAPGAGQAKLGVTKFPSTTRTRPHVVTLEESEANGGPYEGEEVGSVVDEVYNVCHIIVQGI